MKPQPRGEKAFQEKNKALKRGSRSQLGWNHLMDHNGFPQLGREVLSILDYHGPSSSSFPSLFALSGPAVTSNSLVSSIGYRKYSGNVSRGSASPGKWIHWRRDGPLFSELQKNSKQYLDQDSSVSMLRRSRPSSTTNKEVTSH